MQSRTGPYLRPCQTSILDFFFLQKRFEKVLNTSQLMIGESPQYSAEEMKFPLRISSVNMKNFIFCASDITLKHIF